MSLDLTGQLIVLFPAAVLILHLAYRFIRRRSFTDFILLVLLLLFSALFLLEILYLKWPLLDLALAVALGVTAGLHLIRSLQFRS